MTDALTPTRPYTSQETLRTVDPANNYLNRCIEELDPDKISFMNRQAWCYSALATISMVGYTVLAVGAFVATAVYMPIYVPIASLSALLGAMLVAQGVDYLYKCSQASKQEAAQLCELQTKYTDLLQCTPQQIQEKLHRRGITWQQGLTADQISPILAQAEYLEDKFNKYVSFKEKMRQEANELEQTKAQEEHEQIYNLRDSALSCEDHALNAKMQAAFANAVLRLGNCYGTLEDLGAVTNITCHERLLGDVLNETRAEKQYFTFYNRNIVPLSVNDVKNLSITQLGERLKAAIV